jgi:flavin reductase (DIM6/NTAB) family NADH-FMN oxidoreductase RutF
MHHGVPPLHLQGKERAVMKQMLKPFKPAEDRFAGMDVQRSESTGAVIIPDSAAYVECTVVSRMEAGDHVVLYAQVNDGKVLNQTGQSAVHYRRIGTNY